MGVCPSPLLLVPLSCASSTASACSSVAPRRRPSSCATSRVSPRWPRATLPASASPTFPYRVSRMLARRSAPPSPLFHWRRTQRGSQCCREADVHDSSGLTETEHKVEHLDAPNYDTAAATRVSIGDTFCTGVLPISPCTQYVNYPSVFALCSVSTRSADSCSLCSFSCRIHPSRAMRRLSGTRSTTSQTRLSPGVCPVGELTPVEEGAGVG